jgi:16S rRNA (cytidine1402-2'-O)-methyltransferase
VPIPGPSAPITALVVSGLPSDSFVYLGFLPRRRKDRSRFLSEVAGERRTLIVFEAPHRLRESLADLEAELGDRPIAICRELTKLYEEVLRGSVSEARAHFRSVEPRGEFTLVIGGAPTELVKWESEETRKALDELLAQGVSRPEAARRLVAVSGWRRGDIYKLGLGSE